ncbi:dethiobiotin synthase-2 [Pasteurella multocida]|nr:dethiobiotin synthase-2 [Pasteurella multocida]
MQQGASVITQKMIQTGCRGIAEDLLIHRKIQGIELTEEDKQGITCPYVFDYPCSPHLAAKLEQRTIERKKN